MAVDHPLSDHSYIVLKPQLDSYLRGALVESDNDGFYSPHSHLLRIGGNCSPIGPEEVAPLTSNECVILDAIASDAVRYTVYSTPRLLEWGVGLKVGDTVLAQLPDRRGDGQLKVKDQYATATVRWIGKVDGGWTVHHFGVEITVSERMYAMQSKGKGRGGEEG